MFAMLGLVREPVRGGGFFALDIGPVSEKLKDAWSVNNGFVGL